MFYHIYKERIKFIDITIRMLIALKPQSITRFMISFLESQKGGSDKHKPKLLALKFIVLFITVNEIVRKHFK